MLDICKVSLLHLFDRSLLSSCDENVYYPRLTWGTFFFSDFLLLKILLRDYLCARIVKLTNSLVEPSPKNYGFLFKLQDQKETSNYSSKLIVTWINLTGSMLIQPYILSFMRQVKFKIVLIVRGRVSYEGH